MNKKEAMGVLKSIIHLTNIETSRKTLFSYIDTPPENCDICAFGFALVDKKLEIESYWCLLMGESHPKNSDLPCDVTLFLKKSLEQL